MRHLKLLANVVEVARMGSIRKAAERLNLTPSAMNRRIQDLEAEVGTPLFERRPRGVRLTTAGEMFVRYARSQIAEAERMLSQVEDLRAYIAGQAEHHRNISFQEEFRRLLQRYEIAFDERYVWD